MVLGAVLRADLNAEIERSKTLAARNPPPSITRPGHSRPGNKPDDPKQAAVWKLYEDMTSIIVVQVRFEKGLHPHEKDVLFDCVYTSNGAPEAHGMISSELPVVPLLIGCDRPPLHSEAVPYLGRRRGSVRPYRQGPIRTKGS